MKSDIRSFLDEKVRHYNVAGFIAGDPVSIPHLFTDPRDIEIMGFFAAVFAWGQRKTIIQKCKELIERMDGAPYHFMVGHREPDLRQLAGFKHRTFNDTDLLYFVAFLKHHYSLHASLENAFMKNAGKDEVTVEQALIRFRKYFFSLDEVPGRTAKHIASPLQNSACKRINMFLRWMVRQDNKGVDFGLWTSIKPSQLVCPLDLHVSRVARKLGLLQRPQDDWKAAVELTTALKRLDSRDPVKYDFALFGLGVEGAL